MSGGSLPEKSGSRCIIIPATRADDAIRYDVIMIRPRGARPVDIGGAPSYPVVHSRIERAPGMPRP